MHLAVDFAAMHELHVPAYALQGSVPVAASSPTRLEVHVESHQKTTGEYEVSIQQEREFFTDGSCFSSNTYTPNVVLVWKFGKHAGLRKYPPPAWQSC